MRTLPRTLTAAVTASAVLLLAACATGGGAPAGPAVAPDPPADEVVGTGTVLDDGTTVELCLGPVAESYPPQCHGLRLDSWSWDGVDGSEEASGVRWGAYAVTGTYDGERMTVTAAPVLLALYDPAPLTPEPGPGTADAATLTAIQDDLPDWLGDAYLGSVPQDGRLEVSVVWDDGTWQDQADAEYGDGIVIIRPALRPAR